MASTTNIGAWRRSTAGGRKFYTHPTAGRIDQVGMHSDPGGIQWSATPRSGRTLPNHFPNPRAARRALGSDE